jgi:hypothetical protein
MLSRATNRSRRKKIPTPYSLNVSTFKSYAMVSDAR